MSDSSQKQGEREPAPEKAGPKKAGQKQGSRAPLIQARRAQRLEALGKAERALAVNFSIVGVQKAATSSLYRMLVKHPSVAGGPEKEMRFFIDEDQDWSAPDYADYARPANNPALTLAGDATPAYFFWPHALERMRRYDPTMRLMVSLRDPIERAFSQWSMERYWDPSFPDLPDAIERFAGDELPDGVPGDMKPARLRKQSLFTRGLYGQQLRRGLVHFPREQWLVLDFRAVFSRPEETLDQVTDFLGIDRFADYPPVLHRNQTPTDHTGAAPTVEHVARLVERYAADLAELRELSGLDVSGWSTSRVLAGDLTVEELTTKLVTKLGLQAP